MSLTIASSPPFLATGEPGGIVHAPTECTVAQAAEFLDMSEGCLHELLDDEIITFRLKNGERWVQWDSLLEFELEYREQGEALAEMTRWSQEMGLYD